MKTYHAGYDYDFHGKDGPLQKSYPHWFNDYHVAFLDTLDKLGVPINTDNVCFALQCLPLSDAIS